MKAAPIIHTRTFSCDFNSEFLVRPAFFMDSDIKWARKNVSGATGEIDGLQGVRWLIADNGKYRMAGVVGFLKSICSKCQLSEADKMKSEELFCDDKAEASAQLAQIMANMQVETRCKILTLYTEKAKEYLDLQDKYKKQMFDTVKSLRDTFPDGTGEDIIREEVKTLLKNISERSAAFSKLMNEDMKNVFGIIDSRMQEITSLATKYFQPAGANQPALTQNVVDAIEMKWLYAFKR